MGVLLFAATMSAQGQGQQQGQGGQAAQGQQGAQPAQGGAPRGQGQGPAAGRQGGGGGGRGFQNLNVLPRDIPQPQLIQVMQGFEAALGVTCEHCHVYFGPGNAMNNMGSDEKQPKKTARIMMLAARDFNAKLVPADLGKQAANVTPVMCGSCHRGKAIPDWVQPPPPARGGGAAPAGGRQGGRAGGAQ
jgi:hypothetical protein